MNDAMFAELLESVREGMAILRGEAEPSRATTITLEQALAHEPVKPRRVATTIRLPDLVHHMLRQQAEREGASLNALIVRVLTGYIEQMLAAAGQKLLDHIAVDEKVMVGQPVIRGTRLTVKYILNLLSHGATIAAILGEYDGLTNDDIQACILFAQLAEQQSADGGSLDDVIEDLALRRAMDEGLDSGMATRDKVFRLLRDGEE